MIGLKLSQLKDNFTTFVLYISTLPPLLKTVFSFKLPEKDGNAKISIEFNIINTQKNSPNISNVQENLSYTFIKQFEDQISKYIEKNYGKNSHTEFKHLKLKKLLKIFSDYKKYTGSKIVMKTTTLKKYANTTKYIIEIDIKSKSAPKNQKEIKIMNNQFLSYVNEFLDSILVWVYKTEILDPISKNSEELEKINFGQYGKMLNELKIVIEDMQSNPDSRLKKPTQQMCYGYLPRIVEFIQIFEQRNVEKELIEFLIEWRDLFVEICNQVYQNKKSDKLDEMIEKITKKRVNNPPSESKKRKRTEEDEAERKKNKIEEKNKMIENECPICMEEFGNRPSLRCNKCMKRVCNSCIEEGDIDQCPMCRTYYKEEEENEDTETQGGLSWFFSGSFESDVFNRFMNMVRGNRD